MKERFYSKVDEMVEHAENYHGTVLAMVDTRHRVIQVAIDAQNVYIVPMFARGHGTEMVWYTYRKAGGTIYWKRESSGYYQLRAAKDYISRSLLSKELTKH